MSLLPICIVIIFIIKVSSDATLEVLLQSFSNPEQQTAFGRPCDVDNLPIDPCETFIFICITALPMSDTSDPDDCIHGSYTTGILGNSSHFTFYPGELLPEPSGPINPLRFLIPGPLKSSFRGSGVGLKVIAYDNDEPYDQDMIAFYTVDISFLVPSPSQVEPPYQQLYPETQFAPPGSQISMSAKVACAASFYGRECGTKCNPPNFGNFYCDEYGALLCELGWTGKLCDLLIDPCEVRQCNNNGSCHSKGPGEFTCECPQGYQGDRCQRYTNECEKKPCLSGGICQQLGPPENFRCVCAQGYTGIVCETEVLACSSNPCHHSAPCIESTRGFYDCDCLPGYSGENCQYVDLQCEDDSCHQGVCYVTDVNTTSCQCQEGFTGQLCDVDVDECESSPCKHGGACLQPRPATYECRCEQGYSGFHCENIKSSCLSSPCLHGGVCIQPSASAYYCECPDGYTGDHCHLTTGCPDGASLCENGGTCVLGPDGASCICLSGFLGPLCSEVIDQCTRLACAEGATCINTQRGFICVCPIGTTGPTCAETEDGVRSDSRSSDLDSTTPLPWVWVVVAAVGLVIIMALSGVIYVVCKTHPLMMGSSQRSNSIDSQRALHQHAQYTGRPLIMDSDPYHRTRQSSTSSILGPQRPYRPFLTFYQAANQAGRRDSFLPPPIHRTGSIM